MNVGLVEKFLSSTGRKYKSLLSWSHPLLPRSFGVVIINWNFITSCINIRITNIGCHQTAGRWYNKENLKNLTDACPTSINEKFRQKFTHSNINTQYIVTHFQTKRKTYNYKRVKILDSCHKFVRPTDRNYYDVERVNSNFDFQTNHI